MSDAFLITGVPGFIGARLVERLLPQGRRIYLLCEQRFRKDCEDMVTRLKATELCEVVTGDITQNDLGLGDKAEEVAKEVSDLYHLAAIYDLSVPEDLARRVNVMGTAKVLKFLRERGEGSIRHHYVSTCYVAGSRTGMIFEDELDRGQSFKNHYESTKYAAEVLVERSKGEIDTRIFRPGIVIGDSRTGETAKFDGPYPTFGAIMMGLMVVVPGPATAPVNLVPVDFIVSSLAQIPLQPDTAGKTFQLADPSPLTARELVELVSRRLGAPKPRLAIPERFLRPLLKHRKTAELTGISEEALAYFNHHQTFDTANTREALRGTSIEVPPLPSYINQILRYYRDRVELPWRLDTPS